MDHIGICIDIAALRRLRLRLRRCSSAAPDRTARGAVAVAIVSYYGCSGRRSRFLLAVVVAVVVVVEGEGCALKGG